MRDIQSAVVRLLASSEHSPEAYRSVLKAVADGTGASFAVSMRSDETGNLVLDEFRIDGARNADRRKILASAFSNELEHRTAARETLRSCAWGAIAAVETLSHGTPLYEIAIAAEGESLPPDAEELLKRAAAVIEPLLSARTRLAEQAAAGARAMRELRESEEELRHFFDGSKDMIYTSNAEDRFASINDAGIALLGLANRFDAIGTRFSDFVVNPDDRAYFLSRLQLKGFIRDYEYSIKRSDGEPIFCIETAHSIKRQDGSVASIQGIVKDISERIKNEKALWKANLELAEANARLGETQMAMIQQEKLASIGQLAAGVAHEINNPLGFMKSNFQTTKEYIAALNEAWRAAKERLPPEEVLSIERKQDIPFIQEELPKLFQETGDGYARIIEIVGQLKSFARIDAEARKGPYDIEKGIESSLVIAWNEIKYVADVEREFGGVAAIEAEGGSVNQVILNLLVNAAHAIASQKREDRGLITISTREDESHLYCSVRDDGPGIPEELQRKIFDPFFTTKEPGKGTGLGLSISYDIVVNKHGGRISVRSKKGEGATFEIALPKKTLPAA